jgi:predicted nuclease of restriction endonuclease-like (RecB) superfamily
MDKTEARAFYEIEAIKNTWSARELERRQKTGTFSLSRSA